MLKPMGYSKPKKHSSMKRVLLSVAVFGVMLQSYGQEEASAPTYDFNYTEEIQIKGATQEILYDAAKDWVYGNYGKKKQEDGVNV